MHAPHFAAPATEGTTLWTTSGGSRHYVRVYRVDVDMLDRQIVHALRVDGRAG
jgi:hypothetical protein